jgi:DNA helicase II / ATP-dependent DNA helicase PcrA
MTRARDQLHLIQPRRFYTTHQARFGDRYVTAPRTRFIPASLLRHFDLGASEVRQPEPQVGTRSSLPKVDIAAGLRAMWA